MTEENNTEVILYEGADHEAHLEVTLHEDTVWLTHDQMKSLFQRTRRTIAEHIENIFKDGELEPTSVCRDFRHTAGDGKNYTIKQYNLDVIISVGYRVKSNQGIAFRKWATRVLKNHLIEEQNKRLKVLESRQEELSGVLKVVDQLDAPHLNRTEARGMVEVLKDYLHSLVTLNQYDEKRLQDRSGDKAPEYHIHYEDVLPIIAELKGDLMGRKEASMLFGNQKDESLQGLIGTLHQTAFGEEVYPTVEAKAAHLLYFTVKNHPFTDGNKRIGAYLFVWYLEKSGHLRDAQDKVRIDRNALTALTLLVATSHPEDKEQVIRLIMGMLD